MSPEMALKFGNEYNFWLQTDKGMHLSRGASNSKTIKTTKEDIVISPEKTALVIIDMQNYFLHEKLCNGKLGRALVPTLMEAVKACRKIGTPVVWCNMGFHKGDLVTIPPSYLRSSYSRDKVMFGQSIGTIDGIDMGGKLSRGSWNAELWGPLKGFADEGIKAGSDVLIWKNRYSALAGLQPLELWLQDNQITTTLWGGVNTDVCVWGSIMDAYYKGYDIVLLKDLAATGNPEHVTETAYYNAEHRGWLCDSTALIAGLEV